jgi:site-specific DNA-cytosine methylase
VAWVEIDKFCQAVLKKNFPDAKGYGDIKEFDGKPFRGAIDIITGGFPCQDISIVGNRKGITGERSGLWTEYYRVIDEIRPRFVVIENSTLLLSLERYDRTGNYPSIRVDNGIRKKLDRGRIKGPGNAIVPQVAFEIFKAINNMTS